MLIFIYVWLHEHTMLIIVYLRLSIGGCNWRLSYKYQPNSECTSFHKWEGAVVRDIILGLNDALLKD